MLCVIFAVVAVGAVALKPHSWLSALVALGLAGVEITLGTPLGSTAGVVLPLAAFLTGALTLAASVERSGLVRRSATALAALARGHTLALFVVVCTTCALLTEAVSLDGAVVLLVPLVACLKERHDVPFAPMFFGVILVANVSSIAFPQGNPTNLVVMGTAGLTTRTYLDHMLVPGLVATTVCVALLALAQKKQLDARYRVNATAVPPFGRGEAIAAVAVGCAAAGIFVASYVEVALWVPACAVSAIAIAVGPRPARVIVPWRLVAQLAGLALLVSQVGIAVPRAAPGSLEGVVLVAGCIGAAAALANNLPVSVPAAALFGTGLAPFAASIGLAIGAFATPQGSVATQVAVELAGAEAPELAVRQLAPLALCGLAAAAITLWLM